MGKLIAIWAVVLWVSMLPHVLMAQDNDLIFQRFSIQEGLTHNSVLSIIQDRRGFLWFGTYDGLNRFDGYQFKEYNQDYQDTTSISQNLIIDLHEDSKGWIWVGTAGSGLCSLDPRTDKFTRYPITYEENGIIKEVVTISALQEDVSGNLWIGTVNGLFKLEPESKSPVHFPIGSNLSLTINSISLDSSGDIWVGTFGEGLIKIPSHDKSTYEQWKHSPEVPESIISNNVMSVFEDHRGTFWFGCMGGVDSLDRNTGNFIHFKNNPDDPNTLSTDILNSRSITEDKWGNLWIGTTNGLNKLNKERTVFTHYYSDPNNPHSIGGDDIHSVLLDRMGNLWLGTVNGGVSLTNLQPREFYLIQNEPDNPNSLSSNMVRAIFEDKDEMLWIGTEGGGLNKYDRKNGVFTHFRHEPDKPNSLQNDLVSAILEDSKGNFWVGYGGSNYYVNAGGISRMDKAQEYFEHLKIEFLKNSNDSEREIISMLEDKAGYLWITTLKGIKRFDGDRNNLEHFLHDRRNPNGLSDGWCYAIFEDSRDDLWIGTGSVALNKMDKKREGIFHHYSANPNDPNSLSSHSIRYIVEDKQGFLWFATSGGGLCQYDPKTGFFTPFTKKNGLPSNSISRIEIDEDGQLWMSTNKGICRFDPVSKEVQSFDLGYGSLKHHFTTGYVNAGSSTKGKDGTLYFGGSDGIVYFHPKKIKAAPNPAPVVLTRFNVFDQEIPGWNESTEITLPYHRNFISMEFAALSFVNAHNNQYAYYLENFDQDWIYSDDRRFVSYTNMSPGEYVFRVKASNYDGVWSESGINLPITILPPWWRTWWAYLLFLMVALITLYWMRRSIIYWERINSDLRFQRMEAEKMHELDHAKSAFFANISHEFRTPLTLITGTVDTLKKKEGKSSIRTEAYELIERNASKLLHLIHQLLDLSKLESGKLRVEVKPGNITGFLEHLTGSFISLFESREIYFQTVLPEEQVFAYFDASKLEMIFSNLLSNAYKFTPEGGVVGFMADLGTEGDSHLRLTVSVKDTGIGIPKDKLEHIFERFYQEESSNTRTYEGTGIGLSLVKELTELMGGEVSVKSNPGKGSAFKVELPLKRVATHEPNQIQRSDNNNGSFSRNYLQQLDHKTPDQPETAVSDKPKVLLVEDNLDLRKFMQGHLQEDYSVSEAENGETGYAVALDTIPDLIVSDVMMPGMDGICLCEKLKNEDRTSHIPIILLTSRADMDSRLEGLGIGADDYLTKPFKIEELMARVSNLLESRRKLREKYSSAVSLDPKAISVTSMEERFVQKLLDVMEKHHTDPEFDVETLGKELGMSRTNLYRKLRTIINQHPTEFIQSFRLKKAVLLLQNNFGNISEVAYGLGFNSLTYFTRIFKKHYGLTPSEYVHQFSENKTPTQSKLQNYEKGND
jgi:signal transduction histidine kinase/ligand-binding sensor domain-containing protein/DNA-binding response OmpR family regulator